MKKYICGTLLLVNSIPLSLTAQKNFTRQPATIGIDYFMNDYGIHEAIKGKRYGSIKNMVPGVAIHYTRGITGHYMWTLMAAGSFTDSALSHHKSETKKLFLESNFNISRVLLPASRFRPFLTAGVGATHYSAQYSLFIPAGGGLSAKLGREVLATVNAQYRWELGAPMSSHFFYSIGIAGIFAKKEKEKKNYRAGAGIQHVAIATRDISNDTDHDGIPDGEDACPDRPGFQENAGCPVVIPKEKRKTTPSLPSAADSLRHSGKNQDSLQSLFNVIGRHILFETDSHLIQPRSYPYLDRIAVELVREKGIEVTIKGHTDNTGTEKRNVWLSRERAKEVLRYLADKGIDPLRLHAEGFGETDPVADNLSAEGRAANRRVEFKIDTKPLFFPALPPSSMRP